MKQQFVIHRNLRNIKTIRRTTCKILSTSFWSPYTIIRPSALYGERCVSRRVAIFIENAIQNLDITINGNGEEKLDFTYINDLVDGITKCIENEKAINQTFNLTFGNAKKINDLINILKSEFPNLKVKYQEKKSLCQKEAH